MKAGIVERREVYARCPRCGDERSHRITDVQQGQSFGISYCKTCGVGIEGLVGDGGPEIAVVDEGQDVRYILVRVHPKEAPQFLIVSVPDSPAGGASPSIIVRKIDSLRLEEHPELRSAINFVAPREARTPDGGD
jgi:hypothetical protein